MRPTIALPAFAAVAALTLAGCAAETPADDDRLTMTMAMGNADTFTAEWWGWLAADELGYYDELGLDVEFVAAGGSGAAIEQVIAGNAQAGNPSAPSFGEAALVGQPVVNIFTYSSGSIFGIFVPEDSDIESIADLKGANIGISEAGGGEIAFVEAALRAEGIDPITEVTLIPVGDGGPETLAAIESGSVDVYASAYNDVYAIQTAGVNLVDLTPPIYDTFPARGIITTQSTLESDNEALKRFTRGTAMGMYFCLENLDACLDMLKGEIPETFEQNADGISQGDLRFELSTRQVVPADMEAIGAHDVEGTQEFLDLIGSTSDDFQDVDASTVLYDGFIEYANDFDRERVAKDAAEYTPQNG
jgi:NitT/TauT family transport system substrate-binding protein